MMLRNINTLMAVIRSPNAILRNASMIIIPCCDKIQERVSALIVSINKMIEIGKYIIAFLNATIKISCSLAILMYASSGLYPIKIAQSGWKCYGLLPIQLT